MHKTGPERTAAHEDALARAKAGKYGHGAGSGIDGDGSRAVSFHRDGYGQQVVRAVLENGRTLAA